VDPRKALHVILEMVAKLCPMAFPNIQSVVLKEMTLLSLVQQDIPIHTFEQETKSLPSLENVA